MGGRSESFSDRVAGTNIIYILCSYIEKLLHKDVLNFFISMNFI